MRLRRIVNSFHLRSRCLLPAPHFAVVACSSTTNLAAFHVESPRRGAHFRGAMAASEVWSVRRAKEAGEALRPSRTKPCATIPSDRPRPSPRGAPTPSATTTTTGSSGAPIGTVVGLVVAREQILFSDPKQFDRLLNATVLRRFLTRPRYDKYLVQDHRLEDERAHRDWHWKE